MAVIKQDSSYFCCESRIDTHRQEICSESIIKPIAQAFCGFAEAAVHRAYVYGECLLHTNPLMFIAGATPLAYVLYDAPLFVKLTLVAAIILVGTAAALNSDGVKCAGHWQYASASRDVWYRMPQWTERVLNGMAETKTRTATVRIGDFDYDFDLNANVQTNRQTNKQRAIRRV